MQTPINKIELLKHLATQKGGDTDVLRTVFV